MSSSAEKPSSSTLKLFGFPLTSDKDSDEVKKIKCPFCDRKFHNSQALGGHQNSHRRERLMARLAQTSLCRGATAEEVQFWNARPPPLLSLAAPKLPVAEPSGTRHHEVHPLVQVPVGGVDNIDLELRLATSSNDLD